jgi:hypothetical protein
LRRQQKRPLPWLSRPRPTDAPPAGGRPPMRQAWPPSLGTHSAPKPRQRPLRARHKPGRRKLRRRSPGPSCYLHVPRRRQSILHIAWLRRAARNLQQPTRRRQSSYSAVSPAISDIGEGCSCFSPAFAQRRPDQGEASKPVNQELAMYLAGNTSINGTALQRITRTVPIVHGPGCA